ncbi:MAG: deoxyribonuclease IV [Candidatus Spechtbacterales bacterium]
MAHRPLIGGHVSAAGGVSNTIARGEEIGAEVVQFFGSSPRQWHVNKPDEHEVGRFRAELSRSGLVQQAFLHAPYLINLASDGATMRKRSVSALAGHMQVAEMIGAVGVIFHVGSATAAGRRRGPEESGDEAPPKAGAGTDGVREEAVQNVIAGAKEVLERSPGKAFLILENGSGSGTGGKLGDEASELAEIMKGVGNKRVRVCIDTAHGFGAGVMEFTLKALQAYFDEYERLMGSGALVVMQINDSKAEFGSLKDRHENIGEGHIGMTGFEHLAKIPQAIAVPWILEVPGFSGNGPDRKNIEILKKLFE